MTGCVFVPHFPAWAFETVLDLRDQSVVVFEDRHVVAFSAKAHTKQIRRGMKVDRARALAPESVFRCRDYGLEHTAWERLMEDLNKVTPFIEPLQPFAFVSASAREIGGLIKARPWAFALAQSQEVAQLAAVKTPTGRISKIVEEQAFFDHYRCEHLRELSYEEETLEQLTLWGYETLGPLRGLSKRHLTLALGKREGGRLYRHLHPSQIAPSIAHYQPPPVIREDVEFTEPCREPYQLEPALFMLVERSLGKLESRLFCQIQVDIVKPDGKKQSQLRVLPKPIRRPRPTWGFASGLLLDLLSSFAPDDYVASLAVNLKSLRSPSFIQTSLFDERLRKTQEAVHAIHRRMPGAIKRAVVREGAHFHEDQQAFRVWESSK